MDIKKTPSVSNETDTATIRNADFPCGRPAKAPVAIAKEPQILGPPLIRGNEVPP